MKYLTLALIGCGDRGSCYMKYLDQNPGKFRLVAIADPVKEKREYFKNKYNVPSENCFESYEDFFKKPKMADVCMICTQDKMHYKPAMLAIEKKYHLLIEKPIAPTPKECFEIAEAAKKAGIKNVVCHVLRYTPFYKALKNIIDSGTIGKIMNINHTEGVGNIHMSHSYVRGLWRNEKESAPMILAKCCHDTDLMQWLVGENCEKIQSYGYLSYFKRENAPKDAPQRCTDGCPHKDTCYYYAPSLYRLPTAEVEHFKAVVAGHFSPTDDEVDHALKTSPYGQCVFRMDNDVVDHQMVNMVFGDNVTGVLTMSAFNKGGRSTHIMGTKGELRVDMEKQSIEFYDFKTSSTNELYTAADDAFDQTIAGGHGGGDLGLMADLYDYIALDKPSNSISDIEVSVMSHLMCFAAEKSRHTDTVVKMVDYVNSL